MTSTEHLEATDNDSHAEKRVALLDNFKAAVEDGELLFKRNGVAIIIEDTA